MSKDKYGYVSVDLRVFGYKNEPFVFANDVEHVSMYLTLQRRTSLWLRLEKKDCGD
jgi:hypothetical protein